MDKITFRMSGVGHCARALSAELLGCEPEKPPVWLETAAEEGKWHEIRVKDKLRLEGLTVYDEQLEIMLDYPGFLLIGHIDGKVKNNKAHLLEVKSMSQYEFDRWMREGWNGFKPYAYQVSCYMEATGLEQCLYVIKNRNSGYEDRAILIAPPIPMSEIIEHLTLVANRVKDKQLVPINFDPNSLECKRCQYKNLCVPEALPLTPVEQVALDKAADEWRQGKALESEALEYMNSAKMIFEQHLANVNLNQYKHDGLIMSKITYKPSVTYPKAKLLKVFTEEELSEAAETKAGYSYLRILDTIRGKENDD